jgi:hypothetical protein
LSWRATEGSAAISLSLKDSFVASRHASLAASAHPRNDILLNAFVLASA